MKKTSKPNSVLTVEELSLPDVPTTEKELKGLNLLSGSKHKCFTHALLNQIINTVWTQGTSKEEGEDLALAALAGLKGIKAQNELEGMLGAQLVATHQAAMECYRRAMLPGQSTEVRYANLNQANKLTRSYAVLLESLQRYRGKGESRQKVTVEHVHVHEGGQAIVGNIEPRP